MTKQQQPLTIKHAKENKRFIKWVSSPTMKAIVVSIAHGTHDTYAGFIAPLLPSLIERLSLLKAEAGMFILVYQGVSILQPIIGRIGDRTNLRKYALLAPAVTGIFLSLLGPVQSYQTALLYCLISGISSATMHSILPALVSSFSNKNVGKRMSIWMIGGEIGIMLGPILVTAVITTSSINSIPWLMIGGILVSAILSLVLKDMPSHNRAIKRKEKIPFKRLAAIMLPIASISILRSPLRTSSQLYMPVFLLENGASAWFAGISLSIIQGIGLVGSIIGGYLTDQIGHRITLILSITISALAMTAASLTQGVIQIVFFSILSIAALMMLPVGMTLIQRNFPNNRSFANGVYLATLFAINALAGVVTGYIYDQIGGQKTFLFSGILTLAGIPFVFLLPNKPQTTFKHG
ncbi:MAG: MFS transporter [Anaerolineaceae bacterium]|nr:MFS transporter [Anaerolineaceae bacterium]